MAEPNEDPVGHPAARVLFEAWQAQSARRRAELLEGLDPPAPIALRSRYRHLLDESLPDGSQGDVDRETWETMLRLETTGDRALTRGDLKAARDAFTRLLASAEAEEGVRAARVHAHIGLADVARAVDQHEEAVTEYERALQTARADRYRFGELRALVPLSYIVMEYHSALAASELLEDARRIAADLGDPIYLGNAVLGLAQSLERAGDLDRSATRAIEAHQIFADVRSPQGEENAAIQAGVALHRAGDLDQARRWLALAADAYAKSDDPVGETNVLSAIGDLGLDEGRFEAAREVFERGLALSESAGLPRSTAHALQNIARVARSEGDWDKAEQQFMKALDAYRRIDDLLGITNALDKIAEARVQTSLRARMEAVFEVEQYRATHREEAAQSEYRARFRAVYSQALNAAVRENSPEPFAVVADCLAGRRLAGLFETAVAPGAAQNTALYEELVVRADQRWVNLRRNKGPDRTAPQLDPAARRKRIVTMLGATAIRPTMAQAAESSFDDMLAAVYLPLADDGRELLASLPTGCDVLQIVPDPAEAGQIHWLWRARDGSTHLGTAAVSSAALHMIELLQSDTDERSGLRIEDLAPLSGLLPDGLVASLREDAPGRLLIIPAGEMWLVPWSAIPVGDRVLGELASFAVCPSLSIQRRLTNRDASPAPRPPRDAHMWRSPLLKNLPLTAMLDDPRWRVELEPDAARTRERLRQGAETMIVVAHGRPVPGIGHYLELDRDDWLLPTDIISGKPPLWLVLVSCWGGAVPGRPGTDPISLSTLALAARTQGVLATVGELGDSFEANNFIEQVLNHLPGGSMADAVHRAVVWYLAHEEVRDEPIRDWAPLIAMGTLS